MRFISPSFLAFTLLMALLPWVEVRCEQRTPAPFRLSYSVVEQNAFQVALGDVRFDPLTNPRGRQFVQPQGGNQPLKDKKPEVPAAPLMGVFLGLVLVAGIVGFTVPARKARLILMAPVTLAAAGVLLAQILIGFPLLKRSDLPSIQQFMDQIGINDPQLRGPDIFFSSGFTLWFYLALVGTAGGVIGVLADFLNPPKLRPWQDEEEEEGRPRRRRPRRRDDDDDDDRPRRRDDRPRRRDDDDDDDDDRDYRYRRRNDR